MEHERASVVIQSVWLHSVSQTSHVFLNYCQGGRSLLQGSELAAPEFLCAIILTAQCFNILLIYSEMHEECISLSAAATTFACVTLHTYAWPATAA